MESGSDTVQAMPYKKINPWIRFLNQKYLYLMSVPFLLMVVIFNYLPIWGWITAFQKYKPGRPFWNQQWVGLQYFQELFTSERFYTVLRNTLVMSILNLLVNFTIPVIFAILLNELRSRWFKRTVQTISYLPHFVSWVVVAGIVYQILSSDGVINNILMGIGIIREPIQFMAKQGLFWGIVTLSDLWKELGWNSILFLAAISAIDPELYEAAKVDGAGRLKQIWHITLPGIRTIYIVLLILSIGHLISIGFEKQMLLGNYLVMDYSEVLDLYSLKYGIQLNKFSFGTAVNVVNSLVSLILLFLANGLFKRYTGESVM